MTDNTTYLAWLNDARAMELGLIQELQGQAKMAEDDFPHVKSRIDEHIAETRRHAELIEGCIERLGGNVSTMKGVTGVVGAGLQSAMAALTGDDLVKASLAGYASEHLEIASYQALIAAANDLGDEETAASCEQILDEELAMSAWLEENLPEVVLHFLHED